jgi:hypothetical protein
MKEKLFFSRSTKLARARMRAKKQTKVARGETLIFDKLMLFSIVIK